MRSGAPSRLPAAAASARAKTAAARATKYSLWNRSARVLSMTLPSTVTARAALGGLFGFAP